MKTETISVTEAARNFAECLNRAHKQNITFVLLKNGVPVARLIPDKKKICYGRNLARDLTELPEAEAREWGQDLKSARRRLKPLRNRLDEVEPTSQ